jgi:stage II sporulation protein D
MPILNLACEAWAPAFIVFKKTTYNCVLGVIAFSYIFNMKIRTLGQMILFIILAVLVLPALVVGTCTCLLNGSPTLPPSPEGDNFETCFPKPLAPKILLSVFGAGSTANPVPVSIPLEEYLLGVVLAEMPSSFHLEALKAQAVVARTYALYMAEIGGGCKSHPGAHLCTNSTCCQAWSDPALLIEAYAPEAAAALKEKIQKAVEQTAGQVLLFQGKLAEAVYHSTCGGITEASTAVWQGQPLPYLQPVPCNYCSHSPYYRQEIILERNALSVLLKEEELRPVAGGTFLPPISVLERGPGQRVVSLQVGNKRYSGQAVRNLLDLPSAYFTLHPEADRVVLDVHGYGHGVGLCQYGADGMACSGYTYREILLHYYPGTDLAILVVPSEG